jgi:PBP1b-binding outer membrane lipoprotein LpoB
MKILLSVFIIAVLFSGCSRPGMVSEMDNISDRKTNFKKISFDLLEEIIPVLNQLKATKLQNKSLYVTDFVNLDSLENRSRFGFLLSEEIKALVTTKTSNTVHEIEFAKYLKLGSDGTKILSRDLDELMNQSMQPDTYALVGTYVLTQRQVILYLKVINLQTGVIIKSTSKSLTMTREILDLNNSYMGTASNGNLNGIYQPLVL